MPSQSRTVYDSLSVEENKDVEDGNESDLEESRAKKREQENRRETEQVKEMKKLDNSLLGSLYDPVECGKEDEENFQDEAETGSGIYFVDPAANRMSSTNQMSDDAMTVRVHMKKLMACSIKTCSRSMCNHPFLMGFVYLLIFLYRSSPFVFSLLVSASPVLICTVLLLGTLLSFGQPNMHKVERENKYTTQEIVHVKTGVVENTSFVVGEETDSCDSVKGYIDKGRNMPKKDFDETLMVESKGIEVQEDCRTVDFTLFNDVSSVEIQSDRQVTEKINKDSNNLLEVEKNKEVHVEKPRIESRLIEGEVLDNLDSSNMIENHVVEDNKLSKESIDALKKDQLGSAPLSSVFDAPHDDQMGSAPGSSFVDVSEEGEFRYTPDPIDALKENNFTSAPGSSLIDALKEGLSEPGLFWRRIDEDYGEVDGADCDESLDSGSNGAESSSPDASMADIMPMLDELHPLLELQAPQPAHTSYDGSDAGSEMIHQSDDEHIDSGEITDNQDESIDTEEDANHQGEEGGGSDDNDDNEEEEEGEATNGEKEDKSKFAIKWTEVDQKNLIDLGTSELERNQRLENVIARIRARKIMRLMADRNLIDLESSDFSSNVPPIVTTRPNPFELPDDSFENMTIPGSAPSVLLPSRNPFDLPYDSSERKPYLKADSSQQEFSAFQQKEPVYRRNETFSIGPSVFGGSKHERQDLTWRPYFVAERFSFEEGLGYPSIQRQLSEVSDSKLSSIPDSESVNSAVDEDEKSHDQVPEQFSSEGTSNASLKRQLSVICETKSRFVLDTGSFRSAVDDEEKQLKELGESRETELISNPEHGSSHVDFGDNSSAEVDSVDTEQAGNKDVHGDEVVIILGDAGNHQESEPSFSATESTSSPELEENESHLKVEPGDEYNSRSSYSSLSEVDEYIPEMRKEGGSKTLEEKENVVQESGVSIDSLLECEVMEQREPVYDSSPPGMDRFFSFTAISPEAQLEISEMNSLPVLLERAEKESEAYSEDTEADSSGFEETCTSPSQVDAVDEKSSSELEKQLSWSDKLPSYDDQDQSQGTT